ncbi:hypothetical protein [Paenibacillus sp. PSB04]|uniref:hypothetical protein n=1 Tax=Paenibacillus sp. PSB04 TaxID=2866810 RepID=UPI0021F24429|nr:hypothetical protein [Paenibacillus sp. PSB04]UYO02407.1 hypothetical protein K2F33_21925 [Paenibacillus sp. PSB04]
MSNRRKGDVIDINSAIRNLSSARLTVRYRKNRRAVRKIRKSQLHTGRKQSLIVSRQRYGKNRTKRNFIRRNRDKILLKHDSRIHTNPIGPSFDRLIGGTAEISGGITDIPGILVGHAEDESHRTGCTVI